MTWTRFERGHEPRVPADFGLAASVMEQHQHSRTLMTHER